MIIAASSTENVWLTEVEQVVGASTASLERSLITSDGRGMALKRRAIQELLRREYDRGLHDGVGVGRSILP
jgi:hypothetical protein